MSLIEKNVLIGQKENLINKRLGDYSYDANIKAKKTKKETSRQPRKVEYASNSLLDKIIKSNLNENMATKRLAQISYSAINGQRQEEGTYKPEGVQMLGQMGREKPLTAITKEMIQEYQDAEQARPYMIDGEARKYLGADYEPQFPVSFEDLKSTERLETKLKDLYIERTDISDRMAGIDKYIKETNDNIASIKEGIDTKGSNFGNLVTLQKEKNKLQQIIAERKKMENTMDKVNYDIKNYSNNIEEMKKYNAELNKKNQEEVMKYEQSLNRANRNRLNLQQQPYESELEYYKRLKEVEKEKFDPVLYKKYAANEATKNLKTNLNELFSDVSFKENIIKNINDEDKFMINKLFDKVSKSYLDQYGYNNTRLSPRMTAEALTNILNSVKGQEISPLQAIIKRNKQREIYSDTIALARDRQDLEARQAEAEAAAAAATTLQARMKRRPQREIYSDTIELARDRQDLEARQAEAARQGDLNAVRNRQQQRMNELTAIQRLQAKMKRRPQREIYTDTIELARDRQGLEARQAARAAEAAAEAAATNIQRIVRGKEGRINARLVKSAKAAEAAEAAEARQQEIFNRQSQRLAQYEAKQQAKRKLSRAQSIGQAIAQGNEQAQMQHLAQVLALSKRLKQEDKDKEKLKIQNASSKIKSAVERSLFQPILREELRSKKELQNAKKKERILNRNIDILLSGLEEGMPVLEAWTEYHRGQQEDVVNPQKEIVNREIIKKLSDKNATLIQSALRGHKGRASAAEQKKANAIDIIKQSLKQSGDKAKIMQAVRQVIEQNPSMATELSGATTVAEQEQSGLRKVRSDLGSTRAPYAIKKKRVTEQKQLMKSLTPEERRMLQQTQAQGQTRAQAITAALLKPGMKNLEDIRRELEAVEEDEPMAKRGRGLKNQFRKPAKRQVKITKEEKEKDRLRLVVAQIQAGNTNPKLVNEVNKLYKNLYDIDNAYMMLKR